MSFFLDFTVTLHKFYSVLITRTIIILMLFVDQVCISHYKVITIAICLGNMQDGHSR